MPNWVTNIVTFNADEKRIAEIKELLKGETEFDFNKIAPIPKELQNTVSPMRIISQEEYDKQEERIAKGEITEHEKSFGLSRCLTQEIADDYINRFGACDWYSWQTANWGTKWNACDISELDDGFEFNTAWSTPYQLLSNLSKLLPDVEINIKFSDEDFGHNVGEYTLLNGDEIESNIPEGGSREALIMAMDIQYGGVDGYFFEDDFCELYDDGINEYVEKMINIAYDHNVFPFEDCNWEKPVLEYFKDLAIADEKFELVIIIQKELDKVED